MVLNQLLNNLPMILLNITKQIANDQKQHRESITTHIKKKNDNFVNHKLNDTTSTNYQFNNNN